MICKHQATQFESFKFTNNSIKHQPFVYTELNDQTVLSLTNNFS